MSFMSNKPNVPRRSFQASLWLAVSLFVPLVLGWLAATSHVADAHPNLTPANGRPSDPPTATVRFAADTYPGSVGAPLVLPLLVQDAEYLAGWQVVLTYDPTQLEISDVTPGDFLPGPDRTLNVLPPWPADPGHLAIGGYTYGPPPGVVGGGVLAYVTITPQAVGDFSIDISDAMLVSLDSTATVQLQPNVMLGAAVHATTPTAVTLVSFQATAQPDGILLTWETASEVGNLGFDLYRSTTPQAPETLLAFVPSPAPGSGQGFTYEWLDTDVTPDQTYYYWLEDVPTAGSGTLHGPVSATYQTPTSVALAGLAANLRPDRAGQYWLVAVAAVIPLSGLVYLLWRKKHYRSIA